MSHKLAYKNSPEDNLKTWAMLQKLTLWGATLTAIVLLTLFFSFVY
ncbi:MAG: hypothetical protein HRT36_01245 [Alphaproteobacteria bacterium]|nr:hypothetical protein [Alphaproteobacteria bacterium]